MIIVLKNQWERIPSFIPCLVISIAEDQDWHTGMAMKGKLHFPIKNIFTLDVQVLESLDLRALGSEVNEEVNENVAGRNKK